MKKNHSLQWEADSYVPLKKIIRKMKITLFVVLLSAIQIFATGVYSQNAKFSLKKENASIENILGSIEDQSDFYFLYNGKLVDVTQKVTVSVENQSIENTLKELFRGTNISYKIIDRQVVLTPSDNGNVGNNQQQPKAVSGKVTDSTGAPLPGVTVVVKGTTQGMITDMDGIYNITNVPVNATLAFSFVGMKSQEIAVSSKSNINVVMIEESIGLDEVVAVGYGTQSKKSVTGSIQSVGTDELADIPVTTAAQKLQGKLSGVQINQTTGRPGQGMSIRVRGQASLTAGNSPLYVVDGFPINGDISSLNPNEIENISVLKDASSAALYGSRAANGVILVTTKKGGRGEKTSINFAANYGLQQVPQNGRPEMMNATEYAQFRKDYYDDLKRPVPAVWQNPAQYGEGTNFYDEMLRTAPTMDYSLSFSSSNKRSSTTAVLGYLNQDGVVINSNYQRFSLRINSEFDVSDKVKTGFSLAPTYSDDNMPDTDGIAWAGFVGRGGLLANALTTWPIFNPYDAEGNLKNNFFEPVTVNAQANPIWNAKVITNKTKSMRLLSNAFAQYSPIEGLVLKTTINMEYFSTKYQNVTPSTVGAYTPSVASASISNSGYLSWLNENTATYKKSFGGHNLDLLGGATIQRFISESAGIAYNGFTDDRVPTISAAPNIVRNANTANDVQEWSMMSYLSRVNYNYQNRYLLSLALRADGSSRFGKDNRWGYFPSVSAGWIASDEAFLKRFDKISLLKLRGSFGVVGNNSIGNYTQYATVNAGATANNAIFGPTVYSGAVQASLPNSNLTWEKTKEFDFGFDAGFFKNRINLSYDYYTRRTTSLLYGVSVAQESGYSSFMANIGELKFWGHEIMLNTKNLVGKFSWETSFNIAFTDNKVMALSGGIDRIYSGLFSSNITKVGGKIGMLYGMVWDGVYDNQAEFDSSPKAILSEVGTIKYKDVGGGANGAPDGRITNGGDNDDRTIIGDPTPKFTYGMTNTFSYKNVDLSVVLAGAYGNKIIVWNDQSLANLDGNFNVYKELKDRWRSPENPGAGKYGKSTSGTSNERDWVSSRFLSDGSYLAIKNVTLGYSIPTKKVFTNLRVFMSVQQLYTFTKYRGANPESGNSFTQNGSTSALTLGSDFASFPIPRTVSFGLNIGF